MKDREEKLYADQIFVRLEVFVADTMQCSGCGTFKGEKGKANEHTVQQCLEAITSRNR